MPSPLLRRGPFPPRTHARPRTPFFLSPFLPLSFQVQSFHNGSTVCALWWAAERDRFLVAHNRLCAYVRPSKGDGGLHDTSVPTRDATLFINKSYKLSMNALSVSLFFSLVQSKTQIRLSSRLTRVFERGNQSSNVCRLVLTKTTYPNTVPSNGTTTC